MMWGIITANDMELPNPQAFSTIPDEELMNIVRNNPRLGRGIPQQALDELNYRYSVQSRELLKLLIDSISSLGHITGEMATLTKNSGLDVNRLANSSEKMERLTNTLKRLTVALIVLTVAAVLEPIVIELWKFKREIAAPLPPIILQLPSPAMPQTPPRLRSR
jgi:hypothetical protein